MWAIVREISERKQIENKLKAALEEKETLLREIHHRVKNNLQTVMTLIQMRSLEIRDETSLKVITELQEQIRTIAVIYQELFQSERLSRVSMQPYIELLTSHLLKTFHYGNHIGLGVDCKDVVLDATWAMPCGLIINELVTNAPKYAFLPGSTASHRSQLSYGKMVMDISCGFPITGSACPILSTFTTRQPLGCTW